VEEQATSVEKQHADKEEHVKEMSQENDERQEQLAELARQIKEKSALRDKHAEERKERWRALEQIQDRITECRQNCEKGERDLRSSMPRHIANVSARSWPVTPTHPTHLLTLSLWCVSGW
jgi:chromosome segregation ATPase